MHREQTNVIYIIYIFIFNAVLKSKEIVSFITMFLLKEKKIDKNTLRRDIL